MKNIFSGKGCNKAEDIMHALVKSGIKDKIKIE